MSSGLFADGSAALGVLRSAWRHSALARYFDAKAIWVQLNITERCNLRCHYCVEHTVGGHDAPYESVCAWIDHSRALGAVHVELIGGEPLLHPRLLDLLRHARGLGMDTGLTTNGLLLDRELLAALVAAGLSRLQLSVDRLLPGKGNAKALSRLAPIIEQARRLPLWLRVNTVALDTELAETRALVERLLAQRVPLAVSLVHHDGRLAPCHGSEALLLFEWLWRQKRRGQSVDMPYPLLRYYRDFLRGAPVRWRCEGGCKAFYVTPRGIFQTCSHMGAGMPFASVGPEVLEANHRRAKGCEDGCGVACMIVTSLPYSRPAYVLGSLLPEVCSPRPHAAAS